MEHFARCLVITLERTLHEGNLAIFTDIGGSARLSLDWRRGLTGDVTPERVLTEFSLQDAVASEARLAYDYGVAHANDTPRPYQMEQLFPGMHWKSLLVAAFVAWREQHDMAQPTEYSWAVFWDRWTGILYAFDQAYGDPAALWVMPAPLEDPFED